MCENQIDCRSNGSFPFSVGFHVPSYTQNQIIRSVSQIPNRPIQKIFSEGSLSGSLGAMGLIASESSAGGDGGGGGHSAVSQAQAWNKLAQAQDESGDWPETRSGHGSEVAPGHLDRKKLLRALRTWRPKLTKKQDNVGKSKSILPEILATS